jgi:shikimate dehydrogenase
MNTDWIGSNGALEQVTPLDGKPALVLGAGGAARAVVYGLKRSGARVCIANRNAARGEALAKAFGCDFLTLSDLRKDARGSPFDILVQCTPVGLMGHEADPLLPDSIFRPGMVVMDTVYRPLWTQFLKQATSAGCITVHGSEMLLHQGAAQVQWWLGEETLPPEAVQAMRSALSKALSHDENSSNH